MPYVLLIMNLLLLQACGPKIEEGWNSYYYGTERKSISGITPYTGDNDDDYRLPSGYWNDDQVPQDGRSYR